MWAFPPGRELSGGAIEPLAESAQIPQSLDGAAPVPRGHLSVDESDPFLRKQGVGAQLRDVRLAEEVRFARLQHDPGAVEYVALELDLGVAIGAVRRDGFPFYEREHPRNVGIARHRHPGIFPYQVEHAVQRKAARRRLQRRVRCLEFAAQRFGLVLSPEYSADQPVEGRVVERRERVRDDQLGNEPGDRASVLFPVLVDVEDDVGGPQRAQLVQIDILGGADSGYPANELAGMDAEAGSPHELRRESEIADELSDARDQTHDSRLAERRRVPRPNGVHESCLRPAHKGRPRAFRGARANSRSNSRRGRRRSAKDASAICQGMTVKRRFLAMARAKRRAASSESMMNGIR